MSEGISRAALYAVVGPQLVRYELDDECGIAEHSRIPLPGWAEYAWPHPDADVLYVSCRAVPKGGDPATGQWACALRLDPATGAAAMLGPAVELPARAIHLTTDRAGDHLVLAHHRPAGLTVLEIAPDGSLRGPVGQRPDVDPGAFPHQVRITPDGRHCICVARGVPRPGASARERQLEPGSLTVFEYRNGRLGDATAVTVGDGYAFGPRNLDFHPSGPWVYLALETQNEVVVLECDSDGRLCLPPRQRFSSLVSPDTPAHQGLGPILVHPRGHVVYVANRGYQPAAVTAAEKIISAEAENTVVVYAVDAWTGLLTEIQRIGSGGTCPRTLSLDPAGATLVVANSETYRVHAGKAVREVPKNLSAFTVLADGRLAFQHHCDVASGTDCDIAWAGVVTH